MHTSSLADIADLIAAIGIIASLVFVAFQVRSNTLEMRTAPSGTMVDRIANLTSRTLDRDVAEIVRKGQESYGDLSETEKIVFASWLHEFIISAANQRFLGELRLLRPALRYVAEKRLIWLFEQPGAKEWWSDEGRVPFATDTEALVNGLIQQI